MALTAHDCLTLLAIMVRCAEAMRHPAAEDDFVEFHRAADRMGRAAQQLISPQRTDMVTSEPIELNHLVAESEGMLKRAVAPGVSLRLQPGVVRGARIRARRWDLERILLHIVINAARDVGSGGVVVIETSSTHDRGSLIVNASAAAPTSLPRMAPRLSASRRDHSDLGIAAVARLVQRLNGALEFESDSEQRTRIRVDFPLAADSS